MRGHVPDQGPAKGRNLLMQLQSAGWVGWTRKRQRRCGRRSVTCNSGVWLDLTAAASRCQGI